MPPVSPTKDIPHESPAPEQGLRLTVRDLLGFITVLGLATGLIANKILIDRFDWRIDSVVYRMGGEALITGADLYEPFDMGDIALPFIYPPIGAALFAPFTLMEFITDEMAGKFIVVVSSVLLLGCLYLIANAVLSGRDRLLALALSSIAWPLALLAEPVILNADLGQINMLIMALVVYDLLPGKRRLPRGFLIGVAAAIKITPLAMLLYFLVQRDFRAIFTALGSLLGLTAIGAVLWWEQTKEFFSVTLQDLTGSGEAGVNTMFQSNSSFQAMISRWWGSQEAMENSSLPTILWLVVSFAAIAFCAWLMHQQLQRGLHVEAVMVNAALMLLISPISWSHHWVWLPLWALMFLLRWWRYPQEPCGTQARRPAALAWAGGTLSVLLLILPPKWWFGRDGVDVFDLPLWEKFFVSDWVWLALGLLAVSVVSLRYYAEQKASAKSSERR